MPVAGTTTSAARTALKLTVWELKLAVESGLLTRLDNGRYDSEQVRLAKRAGAPWRDKLALEHRLNTIQSAARLGCSQKVFTKLAGAHPLTIVERRRMRNGVVHFFRAGDVDLLKASVDSHHAQAAKPGNKASVADLARDWKIPADVIRSAAKSVGAKLSHDADRNPYISYTRVADVREASVALSALVARQVAARTASNKKRTARAASDTVEASEVAGRVTVAVRDRRDNRMQVTLHLGPTNSGKTYDALQRLAASRSGVYAAPLRMLAREAYTKLCILMGEDNVGLLTGEESINPEAPVICCTAEMAPNTGSTLVLDEAHWAADPDRGYAWTRLLVGGTYDTIEVAASAGAEKFLRSVFSDAHTVDVVRHTRLSPLRYGGTVNLKDIPDASLVVAFSRKAVHALAKRLLDSRKTVGVLYGALPPETRVAQIQKFMDGDVQILVCTDVVGHGINTPASAVVFAQTDKYDGHTQRDLQTWEAAQIAGRAGRFGLGGAGTVLTLTGEPGFTPQTKLVSDGTAAAAGHTSDGLDIERGLLRPTFRDLGEPEAHQLGVALNRWGVLAAERLLNHPGVEPIPVELLIARWQTAGAAVGLHPQRSGLTAAWAVSGEEAWSLVTTPIDVRSEVFASLVTSLHHGEDQFARPLQLAQARNTLELAESSAGLARDLMVVARLFPLIHPGLYEKAETAERAAVKAIDKRLAEALHTSTFGQCTSCGSGCAPHFTLCDRCHSRR